MTAPLPAVVCRKTWWQQQRSGVWAVPAGACACLGLGCPGTIACERETAAPQPLDRDVPLPTVSRSEFGTR